jgi:hypothetical protein
VKDKEILKLMREAVKQGNLDLIKKLHASNEELINVDTVFGSWLHVASAHGQIGYCRIYKRKIKRKKVII